MKHPGHTYGGFVPAISEQGMTPSKINTNYWYHISQQLRYGYFAIFPHMRFCVYQSITTLINLAHKDRGHARVVATNHKQKEYA
jgi:hypothetical protein